MSLRTRPVSASRRAASLLALTLAASSLVAAAGCDSTGPQGPPGPAGHACWDLDGNGEGDPASEDQNGDGVVNVEDCHGEDAKNALIIVEDDLEGVCPSNGRRISTGVDDNGDGVLSADEVDRTEYVCFGSGAPGDAGYNSLLAVVDEAPGANCSAGGKRVEAGLDANENGILDAGEVDQVSYLCGSELTAASQEPAGSNCAGGGLKVESGVDDDASGTLEPGEVDTVEYLCHGADGADGASTLVEVTSEPAGSNCTSGGSLIQSGTDDNENGTLDAGEVDQSAYVCAGDAGQSGLESLVRVETEAAGPNCTDGGSVIFAGLDANGSGTLEGGEISYTSYVCQGAAGTAGTTGSDAAIRLEVEGAGGNCAEGGVAVHSGLDANGNGVLDAGEETSTQYLCHGQDGTAYECDEGEIRYVVCGPGNAYEQRQVCDALHNWVNEGSCNPPGGSGGEGGGSFSAVSLGMTELTDSAPIFGCYWRTTVVYDGEIWVLDGNVPHHSSDGINWTTDAAAPFTDRCFHAAVAHGNKLYVISGDQSSNNYASDVWSYETGVGWTEEQATTPFVGREYHAAASFGGNIYMVGGYRSGVDQDDVWRSADGVTWTEVTDEAPFGQRDGHMLTTWNGSLWVAGRNYDDVWRSGDGSQWVQEAVAMDGGYRFLGSLVGHDSRLWMMGASSGPDDIWYSDDGKNWCMSHDNIAFLSGSATVEFNSAMYTVTSVGSVFKLDVL